MNTDTLARLVDVELELRERLNREIPTTVAVKEDVALHQWIAKGADAVTDAKQLASLVSLDIGVSIPTGEKYLSDFTTTIGDVIAMPRALHKPEAVVERLLILPHEWEHRRQDKEGVDAGWWPRFSTHSVLYLAGLVKTDEGAEYIGKVEGDGYAVTETLRRWLFGSTRPIADTVESLRRHYNLAGYGTTTAEGILRSHYATLAAGGTPPIWAARVALEVLNARVPDLKGAVTL